MAFQDKITQIWVKTTGRKIDPNDYEWLIGPVGSTDIIKDKFFIDLAAKDDLEILTNHPNFGLLENIEQLDIKDEIKKSLNPKVQDFYENTSNYSFEIWSEWKGVFRPFGKLLSLIFSKRLQQLNLPLSSIDTAKGLKIEIIKLQDKKTKEEVV